MARLATAPGQLANLPLFVAQGDDDHVIPRQLLNRTWAYLLSESGAPTVAQRQPGGHQLTASTVHHLGDWIAHRLASSTLDDANSCRLGCPERDVDGAARVICAGLVTD